MSAGLQGGPGGMLRAYGAAEAAEGLNWKALVRLFGFVRPYRKALVAALVVMVVASGAQLLGPYLIRSAIDDQIRTGNLAGLDRVALALLATYLIGAYASARQEFLVGEMGQAVLRDMRGQLFDHMQRLDMSFYDHEDAGKLISYVVNDVAVINELLASGVVTLVADVLMLTGIIGIMLALNARLALLSFSVLPLMVLLTWWFSHRAARTYRLTRQKIGVMVGRLAEDLSTVRVIKAFAEEDRAIRQFEHTNRENRDANIAAIALAFAFRPGVDLLAAGASLIVLWFGGLWAAAGLVSVGTIVAFLNYVTRFFTPIQELSQLFTTVQAAAAGGERILRLLDTPPAILDAPDAVELPPLRGEVEFRHVYFSYDRKEPVLSDVSFRVAPGERVAIVGATGAGKSTIAKLAARHYDVDSGAVLLDGHDVRGVTLASLRGQLGVVPQEPFLFAASIADNIRFGNPEATDEEVREAARLARADIFIEALPRGYDTWVQEGAVNLSLGQRQLICLARVMLTRPSLVILDEATSSVDTQTERLIQEAMNELLSGRSAIVIAHRLATVREVDRIIALEGGRIVEEGTHDDLVAAGGLYSRLYHTQMALA
ncbi:MAG: ABC transporter ATP-binding protein [Anaerolineae bacterium]|nr:ABC transporter ATP-binding protein [Anaerolineae bacterium]